MLRKLILVIAATLAISGCGTFYANPSSGEPAAIFVEKGERNGLDWYRHFTLAEIDGMPVSHIGASSDGNEIRVHPGIRRMVFTVRYLNSLGARIHQSVFGLQLPVEAGKRYQVGGSVENDHVKFSIADVSKQETPWIDLNAVGEMVQPNMTFMIPSGGFVTIPSHR